MHKCFNVLLPRSDEMDQGTGRDIPNEEDLPVLQHVLHSSTKNLRNTPQTKPAESDSELFETLEMAHMTSIATACGLLGRLSKNSEWPSN